MKKNIKIPQILKLHRRLIYALIIPIVSACSFDGLVNVDDQDLEKELTREAIVSRAGAMGMYYSALGELQNAFSRVSFEVALFTDELSVKVTASAGRSIDARSVADINRPNSGIALSAYAYLHSARVRANQAKINAVNLKDPTLIPFIANSYSIEGYSILLLAENACSGVPLTELPFNMPIKYGSALNTKELLNIAIAKFDSALTFQHDSSTYLDLARVGKGRAYLALGDYAKAAEAVNQVDEAFSYKLWYTDALKPGSTIVEDAFWTTLSTTASSTTVNAMEVVNQEGGNGLVWFSDPNNIDPRLPVSTVTNTAGVKQFPANVVQQKYLTGTVSAPLGSWVDVKMIQAEFLLSIDREDWIDTINVAREKVGLPLLTSPLIKQQKVDLLFRERALWFYLEGRRLGDYRRLVNQYDRSQYTVYPYGTYRGRAEIYGDNWVFSPPESEVENNHKYDGCISTNP